MKRIAVAIVLASAFAHPRVLRAADAGAKQEADRARRDVVVVKMGERTVTVGEIEDRLSTIPRFQLQDFGATATEARKKFVETVVVPELLLEAGGASPKVATSPAYAARLARARANATMYAIRKGSGPAHLIDADEVKLYYEQHKAQYDAPERIAVWRILVATREEASAVIDAAKKSLTVTTFTTLAREKSLDKATNLRGGNLGFLGDDGVSNEAGLRADPAVVRAAKAVKDGELVATPVPEGTNFAIVWRRGTVAAQKRSLADAENEIRVILARRAADEDVAHLVDARRQEKVKSVDTELVRTTDLPSFLDVKAIPVATGSASAAPPK